MKTISLRNRYFIISLLVILALALSILLFRNSVNSAIYQLNTSSDYSTKYTAASAQKITSGFGSDGIKIGDVNGDGHNDLVFCALGATFGGAGSGSVYVKFGTTSLPVGDTDLATISNFNIRYDGAASYAVCASTSAGIAIGDVNGDNLGDLIITAGAADLNGSNAGSIWVMYSTLIDNITTTGNVLSLATPGTYNIRYDGPSGTYLSRNSNLSIADVNNDGLTDLVVGAPFADNGSSDSGSIWVMYSTLIDNITTTGNILTLNTTSSSFYNVRIDGTSGTQCATKHGIQVADVNANSISDLVINCGGLGSNTYVFIIYDSILATYTTTDQVVPLTTVTNYNVRYSTGGLSNNLVRAIKVGDVNGDGSKDLLMGNDSGSGALWIVYGTTLSGITGTNNQKAVTTAGDYNVKVTGATTASACISLYDSIHIQDLNNNSQSDLILSTSPDIASSVDNQGVWIIFSSVFIPLTGTGNSLSLDTTTHYNIKIKNGTVDFTSVSFGDFDENSKTDLLLGMANNAGNGALSGSVFGFTNELLTANSATTGNTLDLTDTSKFSVRYDGIAGEHLGYSESFVKDLTQDGHSDLIMASQEISRIWILKSGSSIINLNAAYELVNASDNTTSIAGVTSYGQINGRLKKTNKIIAEVGIDFAGPNKDWSSVTGDVDTVGGKSVVDNLSSAPGASSTFTLYVPNPTAATDGGIIYCPSATSLAEVTIACAGGTTILSTDSSVSVVTIDSQSYWVVTGLGDGGGIGFVGNETPSAAVTAGEGHLYAGIQRDITVVYSDADGAVNLDQLYIRIDNPSGTDIEYYGVEGANGSNIVPTNISGSTYVTRMVYNRTTGSPDANSATLVWEFTPNWTWTEDSTINFEVKSIDDNSADSGYSSTLIDYAYENDLDLTGTLTVTGAITGTLNDGDWVRPGESITWGGLKEVYEGTTDVYPPNIATGVRVTDDDGDYWGDSNLSGRNMHIVSTADSVNDIENIHTITLTNIPTGGSAAAGATRTFTIRVDATPTASITNLAATADSTSQITLTWINPTASDFDHVVIRRRTDTFPSSPTNGTSVYSGTDTTVVNTGLSENTKYYYTVYAYDTFGNFSSGTVVSVTTLKTPAPPVTPPANPPDTTPDTPPTVPDTGNDNETVEDILKNTTPELIDLPTEEEEAITLEVDGQVVNYTDELKDQLHAYEDSTIVIKIPESAAASEGKVVDKVYIKDGDNWYLLNLEGNNYVGSISTPQIKGELILSAIVVYKDRSISEIKLPYNIDPFGYVYTKKGDNEMRLKGAKVTLYVKTDEKQEIWKPTSDKYTNPQTTENTGEYAFYVAGGDYKLITELDGYKTNDTGWFTVKDGVIEKNIEMHKKRSYTFWYILVILMVVGTGGYIYKKNKKA